MIPPAPADPLDPARAPVLLTLCAAGFWAVVGALVIRYWLTH